MLDHDDFVSVRLQGKWISRIDFEGGTWALLYTSWGLVYAAGQPKLLRHIKIWRAWITAHRNEGGCYHKNREIIGSSGPELKLVHIQTGYEHTVWGYWDERLSAGFKKVLKSSMFGATSCDQYSNVEAKQPEDHDCKINLVHTGNRSSKCFLIHRHTTYMTMLVLLVVVL